MSRHELGLLVIIFLPFLALITFFVSFEATYWTIPNHTGRTSILTFSFTYQTFFQFCGHSKIVNMKWYRLKKLIETRLIEPSESKIFFLVLSRSEGHEIKISLGHQHLMRLSSLYYDNQLAQCWFIADELFFVQENNPSSRGGCVGFGLELWFCDILPSILFAMLIRELRFGAPLLLPSKIHNI